MIKPDPNKVYPRENDHTICYLKNVIKNPDIVVGDFTFYHDFTDPLLFEKNNVLYHYPVNHDRLIIGKFCSIACGVKFLFTAANHAMCSLSTFPFPIFPEWNETAPVVEAWDKKGDIVVGNDVWIGYQAVIMSGVRIGDGAVIGTRAVVTKDVPPYTVVGGVPAKKIRMRFDDAVINALQEIRWWEWDIKNITDNLNAVRKSDIRKLMEVSSQIAS